MAADRKDADNPIITPVPGKRIFVVIGVVFVISAAAFWWFSPSKSPEAATGGSAILATAPQSPPQPLNSDGAPKSD